MRQILIFVRPDRWTEDTRCELSKEDVIGCAQHTVGSAGWQFRRAGTFELNWKSKMLFFGTVEYMSFRSLFQFPFHYPISPLDRGKVILTVICIGIAGPFYSMY